MLPSTGLFKSVLCPYFDSLSSGCLRPYCHYKHAKKDEEPEQPVYIPTPKTQPPKLLTLGTPISKQNKLEYVPTKPQINDAPQTKNYSPNTNTVPVYVPSNTIKLNLSNVDKFNLDDCASEIDLIDEVIEAQFSETEDIVRTETKAKPITETKANKQIEKAARHDKSAAKENTSKNSTSSSSKSDHRSSSSRSSSRHRHQKSSTSDKEHKDKSSDRDRKSSSSKSSKHSSHNSKSSSHHHRSSTSHHKSSSSSSSSRDKDKEKESRNSKSSSSRSSSSSKKLPTPKDDDKKVTKPAEEIQKPDDRLSNPNVYLSDDDDDMDIEAQCKMIFEQFSPKSDGVPAPVPTANALKRKSSSDNEDTSIDDNMKKKRIAHENCNGKQETAAPATSRPNHVQNAIRAIFDRQDQARKQQEENAAAALAQYKEAQEKLKEAKENLLKASEQTTKLTPLIPKKYLTPPSRSSFSMKPISNILALERAKKKVEEMRKLKGPTIAHTAIKGSGRIAHTPPVVPASISATNKPNANVKIENQVAPPVLEAKSTKISYNIRMLNYNTMVKFCLDIYPKCEDAWERAQTEELAVFKKCSTPNIYRSSAIMTINKLRKESIAAGNVCTNKNATISHELILAGKQGQNMSYGVKKAASTTMSSDPFERLTSEKAYNMVAGIMLNEQKLVENGFPRPGNRPGTAVIVGKKCLKPTRADERFCRRCSKLFNLSMYDTEAVDACNYHPKGTGFRRGFSDNFHHCCQQPAGTAGCTYGNYHVSDYVDYSNLTGYVTTMDKDKGYALSKKDIFALDCEMCYTTHGIELTRITVVDFNSEVVYDSLVKPENKIIDYNTTFSGITEELLKNVTRTIRDVQAVLLSMFHSKTILVGHSLESDLKTLKLVHSAVVDTSVLFPHKMGPPKKRALKTLCIEHLKRIIQEEAGGHNSAEDAEVCIHLVKFYLRNRLI